MSNQEDANWTLEELTYFLVGQPLNNDLAKILMTEKDYDKNNLLDFLKVENILEKITLEVREYLRKFKITDFNDAETRDYLKNSYPTFKISDEKIFHAFNERVNSNDDKTLQAVILLIFFRESAIYCLDNRKYNLVYFYNHHARQVFYSIFKHIGGYSPTQKHLKTKIYHIRNLIDEIWNYDKNNLLFPIQVAKLVVQLLPTFNLTQNQVKGFIKKYDMTPEKIKERDKNNNYGNTKAEKKQREELIAKIKEELKDYCENIVNNDP